MTRDADPIHVVMCADQGFVVPLAVSIASLAAVQVNPAVVHVVHPGFDDATRSKIKRGAGGLELHWHQIDPATFDGVHVTDFLSAATLYRLQVGDILPELDRVIYLDSDVVVAGPLDALFRSSLHGNAVGAVRDATSPWTAGVYGADWRALEMDPSQAYFNAGVLLIDLAAWRRKRVGNCTIDVLRAHAARWGDQDALNKVLVGDWEELDRRWNLQTADVLRDSFAWALWRSEVEAAVRDPAVIHYTTRDKPWLAGSRHPERERWMEALDRTAWRGWRPPASGSEHRGLVAIARRVVRETRRRRDERRARLPR